MRKIKRIIITILSISLIFIFLSGCGGIKTDPGKKHITALIFPEYDWARNIIGTDNERMELNLIIDNGTDLHSYQPSVDDIIKIKKSDLIIYTGGESDKWVEDVIKESGKSDMKIAKLFDILSDDVKEEEIKEGMEFEDEEPEADEHIWLSVKNSIKICSFLSEMICELDPDGREIYQANTKKYIEELDELDKEYERVCRSASNKTLLFADRFPFRYLFDDYGLEYYAAFSGCYADSEASFKTVIFLSNLIDELGLKTILKIENSSDALAKTIKESTKTKDQTIMEMNSMQSVTKEEIESGISFISIMKENLEAIEKAIN